MTLTDAPRVTPAAAVTLRLCGDPAVLREAGVRVPLGRKALALLAFLSVEAGPHSRQRLASLLWSDADESHAAMSLRQALARLRELIGESLHSDRQSVWLHRDSASQLRSDLDAFIDATDVDALAATTVDVSTFLLPPLVHDAPEFSHWSDRTRATLTRQATASLRRCARDAAARREWSRVVLAAERWLALDPAAEEAAMLGIEAAFLRREPERAHGFLRAFAAATDDDAVTREARERATALFRRLESTVALTPPHGNGTAAASRRLGAEQASADGLAPAMVNNRRLPLEFSASMQEREGVWEAVSVAWERIARGESASLLVESPSGGGRSRVLADATSWAVSRGAVALSSQSPGSALNLEYMVVASLLLGAMDTAALAGMGEEHLYTLSRLRPDVSRRFPALRRSYVPPIDGSTGEPSFTWRLFDAVAALFTLLCEDAPLVVAVDDACWCDRESSALLLQLMQRTSTLPVLWILSTPDDVRSERPNPLLQGVTTAASTKLRLSPLSPAAVARMMAEWSGIADGWEPFATRVHTVSAGLAAHVVATIEEAAARSGGDVSMLRAAIPEVPKPHRRLGARVDALTELDRELLLSLALVAEATRVGGAADNAELSVVNVETLSHVHGVSRLRAARVGGTLAEARLAEELSDGFRCASPALSAYTVSSCSRFVANELRRRLKRFHPAVQGVS
jgi:DNA-binding SARP family transcriptional activator